MMLELRNIFKTYQQSKLEVPVLKNVSLSVAEGEYVAIMGPSGSGKTTLMNIIGCLDNPTSGEYFLEGEDLSQQSDKKMSEVRLHSIGFVFQSFYLLSRQSAVENVALPLLYAGVRRKERLEMARKALERVGLEDRVDFKPTQLSGGQCQRVAIARAIVNNPKILLADEPTGALDTKSGEQIMEIFQKLNDEGVTIVMITHEPTIAAHARRILHIRDGRLVDEEGNFLAPEEYAPQEPTPAEEPLPEDVIPVRDFLADPLPSRETAPEEAFPEEILSAAEPAEETSAEAALEQEWNAAAPEEPNLAVPLTEDAKPAAAEAPAEEKKEEAPAEEPKAIEEAKVPKEQGSAAPEEAELSQEEPDAGTAETDAPEAPNPAAPLPEAAASEASPESEDTETFLDAEITALLDQPPLTAEVDKSGEVLFDITSIPVEEKAPDVYEVPVLISRPSAPNGPEQLSFNIWADPAEKEASKKAEAKAAEEEVSQKAEAEAAEAGTAEAGTPETGTAGTGAPEDSGSEDEPFPFDTAFDAVDPYEPEEELPRKLVDIDLSEVLGAAPEGGFRKPIKVELNGLNLNEAAPSASEEDQK